jgi:hypothetical protein
MSSNSLRALAGRIVGIAIAASLLCGPLSRGARAAEPDAPSATSPAPAKFASPDEWRAFMKQVPLPERGCMKAAYPYPEWIEVPCVTRPPVPYLPATGGGHGKEVGDGADRMARVSSTISKAVGSFDSVTGVTSETDEGEPNSYSLQLNSNWFFHTPTCDGSTNPKCEGWQQFVYSTSSPAGAFMQYWLDYYANDTCPANWIFDKKQHCYRNSYAVPVDVLPITKLSQLTLTGTARAGGTDRVILSTGTELYSASGEDSVLYLADYWNEAEYNVVGVGGGEEAVFNAGSTIVVRLGVDAGTLATPTCIQYGETGETNNLTIVPSSGTPQPGVLPYIVFTETNVSAGEPGRDCYAGAGR